MKIDWQIGTVQRDGPVSAKFLRTRGRTHQSFLHRYLGQ